MPCSGTKTSFHSRLREFTPDGHIGVLSSIFPKDDPRPSRFVSLTIKHWAAAQSVPWITTRTAPNPPIPKPLAESSFGSLKRLYISVCTLDFDKFPIMRQPIHLSLANFNLTHFERPVRTGKLRALLRGMWTRSWWRRGFPSCLVPSPPQAPRDVADRRHPPFPPTPGNHVGGRGS